MAADEPTGVAEATKRWTDHVGASMQRQICLALEARDRVAGSEQFGAAEMSSHLSSAVTAFATDAWKSAGLLVEIAKSIAADSAAKSTR